MNRIEPIRRSRALVRVERRSVVPFGGSYEPKRATDRQVRWVRAAAHERIGLGDATVEAAFQVQRLSNGGGRGLKADMAVRQQWTQTYARAVTAPAPRPLEYARA